MYKTYRKWALNEDVAGIIVQFEQWHIIIILYLYLVTLHHCRCVYGGFAKRLLRLLKIEELFHYLYRVLELLCFVLIVYIPLLWSSPRKVCRLF